MPGAAVDSSKTDSTTTPKSVLVSLPSEVKDMIDRIVGHLNGEADKLVAELKQRTGVAPMLRSHTRPDAVKIAVEALHDKLGLQAPAEEEPEDLAVMPESDTAEAGTAEK